MRVNTTEIQYFWGADLSESLRRIKKTTPTTETTFVYDGWNLLYEQEVVGDATNETSYCWGKDLSGRLQGAGYGAGTQINIQKEFRAGVDLTDGWSASLSGAWNIWGASIDFGGGGSGSWTYLQD